MTTARMTALILRFKVLRHELRRRSPEATSPAHEAATTEGATLDAMTRKEVFARGYDEVLAALKHQDDKLNRTLTALAFLTAAGVTLFTRETDSTVRFPESGTSISAFFFAVFLGATALALILVLAAIGPSTYYRNNGESGGSLLYYSKIANDESWSRYATDPTEELLGRLVSNLHGETRYIAKRTVYKVARSGESGAFVQLAILSLALLGVFSIDAFSLSTQWRIASAVVILLLVAPLWDLWAMCHFGFIAEKKRISRRSYLLLTVVILAGIDLLARAPTLGQHWPAIWYALFALVASRLALAHRSRVSDALLAGAATIGVATNLAVQF